MAMPAMPAMPTMPAATEWETHWTNEGTPYYYNKFTQQSVWEMPPEVMMSMMMPQMQIPGMETKPADPARLTAALMNGNPIRPGMPDCTFFMRSGLCKFGEKCRYNHPPEKAAIPPTGMVNGKYPIRPNKPVCQYWTSTGDCKFGKECTFNHPPEKCNPSGPLGNLTVEQSETAPVTSAATAALGLISAIPGMEGLIAVCARARVYELTCVKTRTEGFMAECVCVCVCVCVCLCLCVCVNSHRGPLFVFVYLCVRVCVCVNSHGGCWRQI
jgi:hypothetical protein